MRTLRPAVAVLAAGAVVVGGLAAATVAGPPAALAAPGDPVTFTDTFEGTTLGDAYEVVAPVAGTVRVSDGKLRIAGQPGDTYQAVNTHRNLVMYDVPAGDFTATVDVAAAVAKTYQGAGLIAWADQDNYVRTGLTFVGSLSPSGIAVETDREAGAVFDSTGGFADRPGSSSERLRLQRVGDTITSSYWDPATSAWVTARTVTVGFATTQVGLYAFAAGDGTITDATFDDFTVTHAAPSDLVPAGTFVLQATGPAPYLTVLDGDAVGLTEDQPTSSLRLQAEDLGDGTVGLRSGDRPLVLQDGALVLGDTGATPTPMRITDAGGDEVVLRTADGTAYLTLGDGGSEGGALVGGAEADAVRFLLSEVDDSVATLSIDGDGTGPAISDDMFGIFYEDINYAADGGLYAELVRNRSFEFNNVDNAAWNGLTGWQLRGGATATVVDDARRLNANNRNYLRLVAPTAGGGVRNLGWNAGVAIEQGATYEGYLWARTTTPQTMTVQVQDDAGASLGAATVAVDGSDQWKQYPFTITATTTTDAGRLAVLAGAPGTVSLDMVSLMPTDRWVGPVNGTSVLRKDLAEKIAAMSPKFLRFPGGCVTNVGTFRSYEESGGTDRQRTYQWKETIGPVEERPTNKNFWGYNQSYGIGYLEYFELAEDLGAEPLPVVSVGANGCGSTIPELTDANPQLLQRWIDDTVDLVEFANGDVTTEWGAVRAELGHPEPFGLDMIGLGNEENTRTFEANFPDFRDALEERYPDLTIISNSGPDDEGARFDELWEFNRDQDVDMVDEHYYNDPDWFLANNHRYDDYDRSGPKVFLGEYASRGNTMANALAEASYMTGLQRNADVVRLASYAPLLANEDHVQWNPDAIWFDNDSSYETPNWEVQKLFGNNVGDEVVPSTFDGEVNAPQDIDGGVFLSTWATSAAYDNLTVTDNDSGEVLFDDDFADAAQWSPVAGQWGVTDGRYVQQSTTQTDARSVITGSYDRDWSNYTVEVDATKLGGSEGFLLGFAAGGPNDFYWWNVGGWNNTRSALQRANGGSANEVDVVEGDSVTTGQTYRLKVVVDGSSISLYRDGELQLTYDQADASERFFQVVTRDRATGDLVAKVVNTTTSPVRTAVTVTDAEVEPTATVTTLQGAPGATNTKADPDRIKPRTREVTGLSGSFEYEFPASSVTFVRMHTKDGVAPVVDRLEAEGASVRGWYADPATVRVAASDARGVDHLEVRVDGGSWTTVEGGTGTVRVTGDGQHLVEVRAVDAAGNVGGIRPLTIGVDATAPVSRVDVRGRTATLRGSDSGAGLDRLEYRLGTGAWREYAGPLALGRRAVVLQHRGVDALGNVEQPGTVRVPAAGQRTATSTAAVAAPPAVRVDRAVRVVARVGGTGRPTGRVTLTTARGRVLDRAPLTPAGRAVLRAPARALGVGRHRLTVTYAGDARHATSRDVVVVRITRKGR
jgi:alpha-L-arabinofuranosidase/regulation of enolase protein 1 (concanavalin A-like superfamily)